MLLREHFMKYHSPDEYYCNLNAYMCASNILANVSFVTDYIGWLEGLEPPAKYHHQLSVT